MNRTMIRRTLLPLVVGLALITVGVACGGDRDDAKSATKGPQSFEVAMKDNVFEPKTFTVSAGQAVTFNLKNNGPSMHNMHILSDDSDPKGATTQPFEAGKTAQLTVKFPKKGTYKFQCDLHVPDMAGTITVN